MKKEYPRIEFIETPLYIHYSPDIENSIRERHHLYKRLFKELYRISGEQLNGIEMNTIYKYNLTHEDLLFLLKDLKAVYNGDFTMEELTTWIKKKAGSF